MDLGVTGDLSGRNLVSELLHRLMGRPNELDLAAATDLGKLGILGQKSVARVDRLDVTDFRGADDPVDHQVAVGRAVAADTVGLVGELQVARVAVGFAEDRDCLDPQLATSADDSQRDLTAVRYEDSLEHRRITVGPGLAGLNAEKWLAKFDRITVFHECFDNRPAEFCRDLVEDFHRLDDADNRVV